MKLAVWSETHAQGKQLRGSNGEREKGGTREIPVVLTGFEGVRQRKAEAPQTHHRTKRDVMDAGTRTPEAEGEAREAGSWSIRGEGRKNARQWSRETTTAHKQRGKTTTKPRKRETRRARLRHPTAATTTHTQAQKKNVVGGGM